MYLYETHCHTSPVSKCGRASVADTVGFYRSIGYDGIFITNHFLDGNINPDARSLTYTDQIDYYFSDCDAAAHIGSEIGIKVFPESSYHIKGTDFLIYGLDKDWYKAHPEIMNMSKTDELVFMMDSGALVIQAHPFREAHYIDHIRLFPRCVHGVEVINNNQVWESNVMASMYARQYGLLITAGSDNHWGSRFFEKMREKGLRPEIAGICSETELLCVQDYISSVKDGVMNLFLMDENGNISYE